MWQAVLLAFLAGVLAANASPHFAKGIAAERFPTVFGSSPVINVLAGWSGLALAALCLWGAHPARHPGGASVRERHENDPIAAQSAAIPRAVLADEHAVAERTAHRRPRARNAERGSRDHLRSHTKLSP